MSDKVYDSDSCRRQTLNHIDCEVKNCRYHDTSDCCMADSIRVTPSYAESQRDTACSTFESID